MTSTVEQAPAASDAPAGRVQSEQSKFVQHLTTYPAITALAGLIASFPVAKIFVSNAVPLLHAIHERTRPVADPLAERALPLLHRIDDAGDQVLSYVDGRFPQLKTVQPADVYEGAQHYVGSARENAAHAYDERIARPLSTASRKVRDQYEQVYGTQVKSRVAPLNDRLESAIDQYLPSPDGTAVPEHDGNELTRTYRLAYTAAERSVPKVRNLYSEKLEEQTHGAQHPGYVSKLVAALAAGKFLSQEAYSYVVGHFGGPERLESVVKGVRESVANGGEEFRQQLLAEGEQLRAEGEQLRAEAQSELRSAGEALEQHA